jgi:hypothetical protein
MNSKEEKEENPEWYRKGRVEVKDFIKNRLSLDGKETAQAQTEHQNANPDINSNIKKENPKKK